MLEWKYTGLCGVPHVSVIKRIPQSKEIEIVTLSHENTAPLPVFVLLFFKHCMLVWLLLEYLFATCSTCIRVILSFVFNVHFFHAFFTIVYR